MSTPTIELNSNGSSRTSSQVNKVLRDAQESTDMNKPWTLCKKSLYFFSSYLTQEDLSRFGRNYLEVGYYTEVLFPKKCVRFIAINNSVDSANPRDNDFTPFLNIMNEWYAKDTSNKIKAVFRSRMSNGLRCSGSIPYGYKRHPGDKQQLFVDEPAAEVVRTIFRMVASGSSFSSMITIYNNERI